VILGIPTRSFSVSASLLQVASPAERSVSSTAPDSVSRHIQIMLSLAQSLADTRRLLAQCERQVHSLQETNAQQGAQLQRPSPASVASERRIHDLQQGLSAAEQKVAIADAKRIAGTMFCVCFTHVGM
jgi:hypothetical protein